MDSTQTIFLTGSSGFIGQYLLRNLLRRGFRVVVMLRDASAQGRMRLERIMASVDLCAEDYFLSGHLHLTEGDLPHRLPVVTWGQTDQIVHAAACLQTDNDEAGEPFATNTEGSRALAQWAENLDIPRFHFISTAYVCGRDMKFVPEVFHDPCPRFETAYELSKWRAERDLLEWSQRTGRTLTITRPSLTIGDSDTGYVTQYGGFYQVARLIGMLRQMFHDSQSDGRIVLPMRIPAQPDVPQNLVPVNYVADAIAEIICRNDLHGRIYHLTNPTPPTNRQIKEWIEEYFQVCGGHFVDRLNTSVSESTAETMFLKMNHVILDQLNYAPVFDCRNTLAALADTTVVCPELSQEIMFRTLEYATTHHWGRATRAAAS